MNVLILEVRRLMCTKRRRHILKDKTVFHYADKIDKQYILAKSSCECVAEYN